MIGHFLLSKDNEIAFSRVDYGMGVDDIDYFRYLSDSHLIIAILKDGSEDMFTAEIEEPLRSVFPQLKQIGVGTFNLEGELIEEFDVDLLVC